MIAVSRIVRKAPRDVPIIRQHYAVQILDSNPPIAHEGFIRESQFPSSGLGWTEL